MPGLAVVQALVKPLNWIWETRDNDSTLVYREGAGELFAENSDHDMSTNSLVDQDKPGINEPDTRSKTPHLGYDQKHALRLNLERALELDRWDGETSIRTLDLALELAMRLDLEVGGPTRGNKGEPTTPWAGTYLARP